MDSRSADFGTLARTRNLPGADGQINEPYKEHPWAHGALRIAGQMLGAVPFVMVRANPEFDKVRAEAATAADKRTRDSAMQRMRVMRALSPMTARGVLAGVRTGSRALQEAVVRVPDSPFQRLFDSVNPESGRLELVLSYVVWMLSRGDALLVFRGPGGSKLQTPSTQPAEVWIVRRDKWTPRVEGGRITGWTFKPGNGGNDEEFDVHEVVHLRMFSADEGVWGFAPIKAAMTHLEQDKMAWAWNRSFFQNGADPGVTFMMPSDDKRSDAEVRAILRRWDDLHSGPSKRGRSAAVPKGWEIDRQPVSHRDMEFNDLQATNRDAELAALGFHKAVLGVTEDLNRATIDAARKMVWSNLLLPLAAYFEDRLFSALFSRFGNGEVYGVFDLSGVAELQEDLAEKATTAKALTDLGVPLNDAAEMLQLGLPRYEWGDVALVDSNKIPADQLTDPLGPEPEAKPPSKDPDDDPEADESDGKKGAGRKAKPHRLDPDRRQWWTGWWRAVGDAPERRLTEQLRRYWFDLRGEQLRLLREFRSADGRGQRLNGDDLLSEELVDQILFDGKPWRARLVKLVEPRWTEAAEQSLEQLAKEISISFALNDPAWERFLEGKRVKVVGVTDRAREFIRETMIQAVREGKTVTEVQQALKGAFTSLAQPARRLRIARTEISQAANGVRFLGMKASRVETVSWVTAGDEVVRDSHAECEALGPVPIGTNFLDLIGGAGLLRTPSDPAGPAAEIINCRCTLVAESVDAP